MTAEVEPEGSRAGGRLFSCVYACFPFTTGDLYIYINILLQGLPFSYTANSNGPFAQGARNEPCRRPVEHPSYPPREEEPMSPHHHSSPMCQISGRQETPDSIPDTNMEKSLFGANIRANIILPERNHGKHL